MDRKDGLLITGIGALGTIAMSAMWLGFNGGTAQSCIVGMTALLCIAMKSR